ncbi:hypothetical protein M408DRAFT_72781 [Serendipita vermifera MAFF 305830]|uniref:Cytochrome P450 n=1 Tax=Serendipita vermifera MAFF 305830 TaxID=933852 RepID=A0A0C2XBC0_SERVB|nr:hypothetical protein M408DRAFT_72781 [Serendipita vermifera MAFF 305830]
MGSFLSQVKLEEIFKPINFLILAVSLYGLRVVRRVVQVRAALASVGNLPGGRIVYGPYSIMARILPSIPYITRQPGWQFKEKYALHQKYGSEVISSAFLFNTIHVALWVADPAVAKQVTTNRIEFPKPIKMYKTISVYGPNIVATEFDEWKRHRRIAAPSFSEKNNRLVCEETSRITTELFNVWSATEQDGIIIIDDMLSFTSRLALMVISAAGNYFEFHVFVSSNRRLLLKRVWVSLWMGRNGSTTCWTSNG